MLDKEKFNKRAVIVIAFLALWAMICIAAFFYYAVIAKDKYIKLGNKIACRELLYYPERAKILDKNGITLAWSEKYYDLYYNNLTDSKQRAEILSNRVEEILPMAKEISSTKIQSIIFQSLSPKQISSLETLIYSFQELEIKTRLERKSVNYPQIQAQIGKVKYIKGRLVGIDGFEKEHDKILSGDPGKYKIMLDRNKNWIKNSFKILQTATPGKNVKLSLSLDEMRKKQK
jgi:penicillin-binding protein 2